MNKREQQIAAISAVASAVFAVLGMAVVNRLGKTSKKQHTADKPPMTFRELYEDNAISLDNLTSKE